MSLKDNIPHDYYDFLQKLIIELSKNPDREMHKNEDYIVPDKILNDLYTENDRWRDLNYLEDLICIIDNNNYIALKKWVDNHERINLGLFDRIISLLSKETIEDKFSRYLFVMMK